MSLVAALFMLGLADLLVAQDSPVAAIKVKAAYLFNFAKFVDWPKTVLPETNSPVVLCILGRDPFGRALEETIGNATAEARPIIIRRTRDLSGIEGCHILFISSSESRRLGQILARVRGEPVLTVSDMGSFTEHGGIIQFFEQGKNLKFEVNVDAASRVPVAISSKLLRVARIYREPENR